MCSWLYNKISQNFTNIASYLRDLAAEDDGVSREDKASTWSRWSSSGSFDNKLADPLVAVEAATKVCFLNGFLFPL